VCLLRLRLKIHVLWITCRWDIRSRAIFDVTDTDSSSVSGDNVEPSTNSSKGKRALALASRNCPEICGKSRIKPRLIPSYSSHHDSCHDLRHVLAIFSLCRFSLLARPRGSVSDAARIRFPRESGI
jgi:hypothetical protein